MLSISTMVARNKWDVHNSILGLFMSYTMTGVVTQVIKVRTMCAYEHWLKSTDGCRSTST